MIWSDCRAEAAGVAATAPPLHTELQHGERDVSVRAQVPVLAERGAVAGGGRARHAVRVLVGSGRS